MSHIKCHSCIALTDTHTTKLCIPPRNLHLAWYTPGTVLKTVCVCKRKSLLAEMNVKTETFKTLTKFCKLG